MWIIIFKLRSAIDNFSELIALTSEVSHYFKSGIRHYDLMVYFEIGMPLLTPFHRSPAAACYFIFVASWRAIYSIRMPSSFGNSKKHDIARLLAVWQLSGNLCIIDEKLEAQMLGDDFGLSMPADIIILKWRFAAWYFDGLTNYKLPARRHQLLRVICSIFTIIRLSRPRPAEADIFSGWSIAYQQLHAHKNLPNEIFLSRCAPTST